MNITAYIRNNFLKFFGDIKVFRYPLFMLYDPGSYKLKGDEIRKVIETVQPGDIMIRGYSNYLDGFFIPGFFSHAGLFLGELNKGDFLIPEVLENKFYEGKQVVIHAMAEGVFTEDVINFCKCDYLIILRRNEEVEQDVNLVLDFDEVHSKALRNIGKPYDFKFDFSDIGNLSCTELVYLCNEHFLYKYNIKLKKRRVLFFKKEMLVPDDFITPEFKIVFSSRSIKPKTLEKILNFNNKYHGKKEKS